MDGLIGYVLAKGYVNQSLKGMGALKGAACQIQSIIPSKTNTEVIFLWQDNLGVSHNSSLVISHGTDGKTAYEVWEQLPENNGKTKEDFFTSLKGNQGPVGESAYELYCRLNNKSTNPDDSNYLSEDEFLEQLAGTTINLNDYYKKTEVDSFVYDSFSLLHKDNEDRHITAEEKSKLANLEDTISQMIQDALDAYKITAQDILSKIVEGPGIKVELSADNEKIIITNTGGGIDPNPPSEDDDENKYTTDENIEDLFTDDGDAKPEGDLAIGDDEYAGDGDIDDLFGNKNSDSDDDDFATNDDIGNMFN